MARKKAALASVSGRRWWGLFPPKFIHRHPDGRLTTADDEKTFKYLLRQDEKFYKPISGESRERIIVSLSRDRAELLMTVERELTKREMLDVIRELKGQLALPENKREEKKVEQQTIEGRYRKLEARGTVEEKETT